MALFQPANLIAGLLFGIIGLGALSYGKKLSLWKPAALGIALMAFPLFFSNPWILWGIGGALCTALWFHHDE